MSGEFDYLLKPIRPDAPPDMLRKKPLDELIERRQRKAATVRRAEPPPPTPPRREGGSPRIHVEIEIVQRAPTRPARSDWAARIIVALFIIGLIALCGCAHAQPSQWQSYKQGFMTYGTGTDAQGHNWQSQSYDQGFTRYTDMQGPNGTMVHCESRKLNFVVTTECNE